MNNSTNDMSKSDILPPVNILLRIFPDEIRRNGNEVPSRRMFDLVNETSPQGSGNITTNITRMPMGINVDLEISLDSTDGNTENGTCNDESTIITNADVAHNSFEAHEGEAKETPEEEADEPTDNIEQNNVHQRSFEETNNSKDNPFHGKVPSEWYLPFLSESRFQYGRRVEALVRFFESLSRENMACQQSGVLTKKPLRKRNVNDQQAFAMADSTQSAQVEHNEEPILPPSVHNFTNLVNKRDLEIASDQASSDSGLSQSDASESMESLLESRKESSTTESDCDQQGLLIEATVEKVMSTGDISNQSDQGNYEGHISPAQSYHSLGCPSSGSSYNIDNNIKTRSLPSIPEPNITGTKTVVHYESVPDVEGELIRNGAIQREIVYQTSKAVLICRSQRKVFKQDIQVEAEKILLLATCRRDAIDEELQRGSESAKDTPPPISVSVSLRNINFSRAFQRSKNRFSKKYSLFFILVLEAGMTVLASRVVQPEATEIVFTDYFQFEGHSEDFAINVKLFALALKNRKKKNKTSRPLISALHLLPDHLQIASSFNLLANSQMKPSGIWLQGGKNHFTLTQVSSEVSLSNLFSADAETHLRILVFQRGFVTVGMETPNRLPVWNRRWCVLDGTNLRYWNCPNEEDVCKPMGHLDLMHASSYEVLVANKELCPWPKSFSLKMRGSGSAVREFFMSVETLEELNEWRKQLSLVLGVVSRWKSNNQEAA